MKTEITKRGVIMVTPVCQLKCRFCYYAFMDGSQRKHPSIDMLKKWAYTLRNDFKLEAVDLTGQGEPTTHPNIRELVDYCNQIGLKPAIITNGQISKNFIDLDTDWLVSIHDIGEHYEYLTQVKNSWSRMKEFLEELKSHNKSFRVNTVVSKHNLSRLKQIVDTGLEHGARIQNFIIFNPHEGTAWANKTNIEFQAKYSEIEKPLKEAIDYAMSKGLWCNVRYIPLCMMKGYEHHVCNFHQWIYDPYEWDEASGNNINLETEQEYIDFIKMKCRANHFKKECERCMNKDICDGIYPQYIREFGDEEFVPKEGEAVKDPMYYRGKYVEEYSK